MVSKLDRLAAQVEGRGGQGGAPTSTRVPGRAGRRSPGGKEVWIRGRAREERRPRGGKGGGSRGQGAPVDAGAEPGSQRSRAAAPSRGVRGRRARAWRCEWKKEAEGRKPRMNECGGARGRGWGGGCGAGGRGEGSPGSEPQGGERRGGERGAAGRGAPGRGAPGREGAPAEGQPPRRGGPAARPAAPARPPARAGPERGPARCERGGAHGRGASLTLRASLPALSAPLLRPARAAAAAPRRR